jgi:hypothetical protein
MFSHQPTVAIAAIARTMVVLAGARAHRAFSPVFRIRAPRDSAVARHPTVVETETQRAVLNGASVSGATAHATRVGTQFSGYCNGHGAL